MKLSSIHPSRPVGFIGAGTKLKPLTINGLGQICRFTNCKRKMEKRTKWSRRKCLPKDNPIADIDTVIECTMKVGAADTGTVNLPQRLFQMRK